MAENATFDLELDDGEGLLVSVDVPNRDGEFEREMVANIKRSVIDPVDGIDVDPDRTTLGSLSRNTDGSYTVELLIRRA